MTRSQFGWDQDEKRRILKELRDESWWETKLQFNGIEVHVTINSSATYRGAAVMVEPEHLDAAESMLRNLARFHKSCLEALRLSCDEDDGVLDLYREVHLDAYSDAEMGEVFGHTDRDQVDTDAALDALKLVGLGFYPGNSTEAFAVFDYSFEERFSDPRLVVKFDEEGHIVCTTWES